MFLWLILLLLVVLLIGSVPNWPHSRDWGPIPALVVLIMLILLLCLWMFGWLPMWMHGGRMHY